MIKKISSAALVLSLLAPRPSLAAPENVSLSIEPDNQRLAVVAKNQNIGAYRVEITAPFRSAVEVVPAGGKTVLGWFNTTGAQIYPEDLSFRSMAGDFHAKHQDKTQYIMPLDRVPDREYGVYVFSRSPRGIPVRVARSGRVLESRLDPFDRWHILLEHEDHTLGRYRPMDCDLQAPPVVGQTLKAGTVLCRTTSRKFTFAVLQATRSLASERKAYEALAIQWAPPLKSSENDAPAQGAKSQIAGSKASVATGKVSQVANEAVAPPPPADKVASNSSADSSSESDNAEENQGYDWPLLLGSFLGFFGVLGGLGGYAFVAQRKEAARLAELKRHREELAREQEAPSET